MSAQLKELFSGQDQANVEADASSAAEERAHIMFEIAGSRYVTPIGAVREVVEVSQILPYPEPAEGHVGIINVRGRILPVLAPARIPEVEKEQGKRLLIMETEACEPFAVRVGKVKKVSVPPDVGKKRQTFLVDGHAVEVLDPADLGVTTSSADG